jgi:hypothetical protein
VASIYKILWSMKKLWTGHKIYPVTDYVNLWPPSVILTLEVGVLQVTQVPLGSYGQTDAPAYFYIPLFSSKRRGTIKNDKVWTPTVTLTLVVGTQVLFATHHTSMVISYMKEKLKSFHAYWSFRADTTTNVYMYKAGRTNMPLKWTYRQMDGSIVICHPSGA